MTVSLPKCFLRIWHDVLKERDITFRMAGAYTCAYIFISVISLASKQDVLGALTMHIFKVKIGAQRLGVVTAFYMLARILLAAKSAT